MTTANVERSTAAAAWISILLTVITLLAAALAWAAKAQTDTAITEKVQPVESRVTRLEAKREEDVKKLDEMKAAVDETNKKIDALKTLIIERLPPPKK